MRITFLIDRGSPSPPTGIECFAHDRDVLRAVFHAINELRILDAVLEEHKKERRACTPEFERFVSIDVKLFRIREHDDAVHAGLWAFHIAMKLRTERSSPDWWCQLFAEDWTVHSGIPRAVHRWHNGTALVPSRARVKWNAVRPRMLGLARALVVFGNALDEVRLRPDGSEYRRVKARFETMAAVSDARASGLHVRFGFARAS